MRYIRMQTKHRASIVPRLRRRRSISFASERVRPTNRQILAELRRKGPNASRFIGIAGKTGFRGAAPFAHEMLKSSQSYLEISSAAHALASLGYAPAIPDLFNHLERSDGAATSCAQALATFALKPAVFEGIDLPKPIFMNRNAEQIFESQILKPISGYRNFRRQMSKLRAGKQ